MWKLDLGWDEDIPEQLKVTWQNFSSQIDDLNRIKIKRWVGCSDSTSIELHGFCDSSELAYGACIYVLSVNRFGNKESMLLTAKSRVAPVEKLTLPRLELLGAHLLAKLMNTVKKTIDVT